MNVNTEHLRPQIHYCTNQLPATFRTWLHFYDSIPEAVCEANVIHTEVRMNRRTFEEATGEGLGRLVEGIVKYAIEREYLLARVGEELLPARLHKKDVNELERAMYEASKYTTHSFNGAVNLLTPLWAVACDK